MTAPGRLRERAAEAAGRPAPAERAGLAERARFLIYAGCLAVAFALHLAVHGRDQGLVAWVLAFAALAGLASAVLVKDFARQGGAVRGAALLATGIAVAVPLGPALAHDGRLANAVATGTVWPPILVALFASRVLAELADLRFAAFWRGPFHARRTPPLQPAGAALALGIALTLLFYHAAGLVPPQRGQVLRILQAALLGDTALHYAILLLFFVITAFVVDAARLHARDGAALAALRALAERHRHRAGALGAADLQRLLSRHLAPLSHTRAVRLVEEALADGAGRPAPAGARAGFERASRQFIKGLVPFLPLLGFLGTVVGLASALAELPRDLGEGGRRAALDIGGTLAGLAIKFETTLLGLLASLLVSFALALLEKSEAELAAACARLVEAVDGAPSRAA